MKNGAADDARRASWPWQQILTGSSPQQHNKAYEEDDLQYRLSAGPGMHSGQGQKPLDTKEEGKNCVVFSLCCRVICLVLSILKAHVELSIYKMTTNLNT